jgi:hypothetical protein
MKTDDEKVVNESTVAAVGGCQQHALKKLITEMGYVIVAEPTGVVARPGLVVKLITGDHLYRVVISRAAYRRLSGRNLSPGCVPYVHFDTNLQGIVSSCEADILLVASNSLQIIGYEDDV